MRKILIFLFIFPFVFSPAKKIQKIKKIIITKDITVKTRKIKKTLTLKEKKLSKLIKLLQRHHLQRLRKYHKERLIFLVEKNLRKKQYIKHKRIQK